LTACDCCGAGEGVWTSFGGPEGVDGCVVEVWEERFHGCEGATCVAGFVGVLCNAWSVCVFVTLSYADVGGAIEL
jgi:hypothetical protein